MTRIYTFLLLTALLVVAPISTAHANPIPPSAAKGSLFIGCVLLALLAEIVVTLLLLKKYRFMMLRLGVVYLLLNVLSFIFFFSYVLPTCVRVISVLPVAAFLAEGFVVVLESASLFLLLNLDWFRSSESEDVPLKSTALAVMSGNVTSVVAGFALFLLTFSLRF